MRASVSARELMAFLSVFFCGVRSFNNPVMDYNHLIPADMWMSIFYTGFTMVAHLELCQYYEIGSVASKF
jgi:hypothetical protein